MASFFRMCLYWDSVWFWVETTSASFNCMLIKCVGIGLWPQLIEFVFPWRWFKSRFLDCWKLKHVETKGVPGIRVSLFFVRFKWCVKALLFYLKPLMCSAICPHSPSKGGNWPMANCSNVLGAAARVSWHLIRPWQKHWRHYEDFNLCRGKLRFLFSPINQGRMRIRAMRFGYGSIPMKIPSY